MFAVNRRGRSFLLLGLFLLCILFVTIPQMVRSYHASAGLKFYWTTSKVWVASAECAKDTGKFLVLCRDGKVVPIADGFGGDDLGHALALEIYSAVTGNAVQFEQISTLNTTVNYVGLALLALLLLSVGLPIASLAILTAGTLTANQLHLLSPHPAQFGATCLAALLPISILAAQRMRPVWLIIGLLSLAVAILFREAIGAMGVVVSGLAVIVSAIRQRSYRELALLLALAVAALTPTTLLRVRDYAYQLPPPEKLESHGAWANLYMGLGAVPNPFGIKWSDFSAIDAVKAVDPSVEYLSPRFFNILRTRYFEIVKDHPVEVTSIYFRKLVVVLQTVMPKLLRLSLWLVLAILGLALTAVRWWRRSESFDSVVAVSVAFCAMFIGQAVLINFDMQYLFPIQIFPLLSAGACLDIVIAPKGRPADA